MAWFSQRQRKRPEEYDKEVSAHVRARLFHSLSDMNEWSVTYAEPELHRMILKSYGSLRGMSHNGRPAVGQNVRDHWLACDVVEFLDLLEMIFHTSGYGGGPPTVEVINRILEEENIGYELTEFLTIQIDPEPREPDYSEGRPIYGPTGHSIRYRYELPQVISKGEKALHAGVVQPALALLSDGRFASANQELIEGLVHLRHGKYREAVQSCGSAIETVLKTICSLKGWKYDKDRATLKDLLDLCQKNSLFFPFYGPIITGTGTIRNKLSAHGKGPDPDYIPTKELAEHMVYTCCANAVLLISLAKLP